MNEWKNEWKKMIRVLRSERSATVALQSRQRLRNRRSAGVKLPVSGDGGIFVCEHNLSSFVTWKERCRDSNRDLYRRFRVGCSDHDTVTIHCVIIGNGDSLRCRMFCRRRPTSTDHRGVDTGVGGPDPLWKYVGGVSVCFDPLKCHILSFQNRCWITL